MATRERGKTRGGKSAEKEAPAEYLPEVYKDFIKRYPDVSEAYNTLNDRCHKTGQLDIKTRRLVKLGISIGANSEGSVRSHVRRAVKEGISQEDIRQVVLLSFSTVGFPRMIASHKWVEEVLQNPE